jgi:phosphoglycerate dehydrogenase-like enzyme
VARGADADFVVVTALLNEETRRLIDANQIGYMKPTAYVIDVARGPVVEEQALYAALSTEKIAGAALDVFEEGQTPAANPILRRNNGIVTSHSRCWTDELFANIAHAAEGAVHAGRPPKFAVDPEALAHPHAQAWRR